MAEQGRRCATAKAGTEGHKERCDDQNPDGISLPPELKMVSEAACIMHRRQTPYADQRRPPVS